MNELELDRTLDAIHQGRTDLVDPPELHQRARVVPLQTPQRRGFPLHIPQWRFQSMFSATKFVVAGVIVALFGGFLLAGVLTQQGDSASGAASNGLGAFSPTSSLAQPRAGHTATRLPDGSVLVVGGDDEGALASAVIWEPGTESFGPTGSLVEARWGHTATLLHDGRVLVVGGAGLDDGTDWLHSAEVWDPATSMFSPAGSLTMGRDGHDATLLPDGRVLVFGGQPFMVEIWDPATNTFSTAGFPSNPEPRAPWEGRSGSITALRDGRVLFLAGRVDVGSQAWVWDPGTDTSSPAGSQALSEPLSATLLPDGRVLVLGGEDSTSAAVWDPETASFSPTGSRAQGRQNHSATALSDGRVLIVGGCFNPDDDYCHEGDAVDSAEIWDPETNTFGPTGPPAEAGDGTATLLRDGRVLFVGGEDDDGALASAEVWEPGGS